MLSGEYSVGSGGDVGGDVGVGGGVGVGVGVGVGGCCRSKPSVSLVSYSHDVRRAL